MKALLQNPPRNGEGTMRSMVEGRHARRVALRQDEIGSELPSVSRSRAVHLPVPGRIYA